MLILMEKTYHSQVPNYLLPLEHSHSCGVTTDSTQTLKRKKIKGEHNTGTSTKRRLTQQDINGVQCFVLFIGYAHSGHSIIGSMMDAHPNMVIAHEYSVMNRWWKERERCRDKKTLFNELCGKSRSTIAPHGTYNNQEKGYTLAIPNLWQGCRYTDLKVIGDKRGGLFTRVVISRFEKIRRVFDEVRETVGVPIKLIHVVRNPFDIIATTFVRPSTVAQHRWDNNDTANITTKTIPTKVIYDMKKSAEAIMAIEKEWGADMLNIHHADFVHDPKSVLQRICEFVDVDCPKKYLETCYNKTFKTVSKSRHLIEWPSDVVEEGEAMMREIPFFQRYSFSSD